MKRSRFISLMLAGMLGVTSISFPAEVFGSELDNEVIEVFEEDQIPQEEVVVETEESMDNAAEEVVSEEAVSEDEVVDRDGDQDEEEWLDIELDYTGLAMPLRFSDTPKEAVKAEFTVSLWVDKEDGSKTELCKCRRKGLFNLGTVTFHQRYFDTNGEVYAVIEWKEGNKNHRKESNRIDYKVPSTRMSSPQNIGVETDEEGTWLEWDDVKDCDDYYVDIYAEGCGPSDMVDYPRWSNPYDSIFNLGEFLDKYGYQKWIIEITANSKDIRYMRCSEPARFVYDPDEGLTLTLDKEELNLATGKSETIKANFSGKPADKTVIWMSSDSSVATVDESGNVTAVGVGETEIWAKTPNGTESEKRCKVTVYDQISSIKLDPSKKTITEGDEFVLRADVGSYTPGTSRVITSTGPVIEFPGPNISFKASEDNNLTLTPYGEGKVLVKATSSIGGDATSAVSRVIVKALDGSDEEAFCDVTIKAKDQDDHFIPLKKLGLNATSITLNEGYSFSLETVCTPENWSKDEVLYEFGDEQSRDYIEIQGTKIKAKDLPEGKNTATAKVKVTAVDKTGTRKEAFCIITVVNTEVKINKISWSQGKVNMGSNATVTLNYDTVPAGNYGKVLDFKTSPEGIVEVHDNEDGSVYITAKNPGTTKLTVTSKDGSNKSATCTIKVGNPVEKVEIKNAPAKLQVGKSVKLKAEVSAASGKPANTEIEWKINKGDINVASIDKKNGKVTAKSAGTVTITAVSKEIGDEGKKSHSVTIEVYEPVKKIALSGKSSMSVYEEKQGEIPAPVITPMDATNQIIQWTSSDTGIVELEKEYTDGEKLTFKAHKPGKAKITGTTTDGSKKKVTVTVTVLGRMHGEDVKLNIKSVPKGLTVDNNNSDAVTLSGLNAAKKQSLTLTPVLTAKAANKNVSFTSSNPKVVTVDKKGKVTAVGEGSAVITMITSDGNFTATCTIYTINKK